MANLLSYIMIISATLSIVMGFYVLSKKDYFSSKRFLFFALALSSSWWSFWFGMMIIQTVPYYGYLCRSVAMPGVFAYLILASILMVKCGNLNKKISSFITFFSYFGIILLPFNVMPDGCTFYLESFGMAYKFNSDNLWMSAYTIYSIIIGINMLIITISMFSKKNRRSQQILSRFFLCCLLAIAAGMILDTVCPILGIGAFPGSTLTQFFGTFFVFLAIRFEYRNNVTFAKISDMILHAVTTPVVITGEDGHLLLANDAAVEFLDINEKTLNKYFFPLFFEDRTIFHQHPKSVKAVEAKTLHSNRDCSISIDEFTDDFKDTLGYIIVIRDVTERNRLIADLTEARILADRANESKSIFLANMSHEIRTPINAVLGMDEMILRENDLDNIRNYAQNIRTAGKTLLAIINEILDFSKIESGKMELVNANFALDTSLFDLTNSIFLRAKEKNLTFETDLDPSTPKILYGDEIRVKQIVMNLLTNAVKYTEKGTVHLTMSYNKIDDNKIILRFIVKDTGIGIKEEDMSQLFASFKRLDDLKNRSIEGTGLGLNIVDSLLNLMGGTIQVESEYKKGSTFTVSLPIMVMDWSPIGSIEKMDKLSPEFVPFKADFIAPEATILSVDDNRVNLKVFKGLLKETQIRIDAVTSGEQCLEFVKKKKYDIIFLDHMMPGMDGVETLEKLRTLENNLSKDAPVIVLTANALNGVEEKYYGYGFDGYLAKPIDYDALEAMIKKLLPSELIHKV